ncbi:hypothetical protein WICPIJ_007849 [Wickerhamomyces pijperi]|uniref:non-specific serine/threonine protein kinase n=1 Tax=Wickerhamomyces pijperi TaxID=599730 RepID=A0A9P8TJJ0_WICPI|nr:hypothetical protein WICPIJ_007849 [Wickerhamomyces pijperi]
MMSSWKQKLKEFSSSARTKPTGSPDESSLKSVSSTSIDQSAQRAVSPIEGVDSPNKDIQSPQPHKDLSDNNRRETITPLLESLSVSGNAQGDADIAAAATTHNEADIASERTAKATNQSKAGNFNPGLLTVKIYQGSEFIIPFSTTRDSGLISKLQGTVDDSHLHRSLYKALSNVPLEADNTIPASDSNLISSLLPASIKAPPSDVKTSMIYFTLEFENTNVTLEADSGSIRNPVFNKVSQFDVTKPGGELKFQVFLRLPSILCELGDKSQTQDVLVSSSCIRVDLSDISNPVRIYNHIMVNFLNDYEGFPNSENGNLTITVDFKPYQNKHLCIEDFDLLKVIGKGSFGKVMQVRKKDSGKIYALKAIRKSHIVSRSEVVHTLAERTVLARVENPFVVPLKFSFQSPEKLYLVLSFINGGELFYHLQKEGRFDLQRSRLYTAELLSALECLHSLDVIYRDLKPENILLDYKGHIALCDFGLCKLNMKNSDKTKTFCGTPEYLAPELLLGNGYTKSVDWWTLGVLLYEMLTGLPPYYDTDVSVMYQKILKDPLRFPSDLDPDAKDILIHLLARDPKIRLGTDGSTEIKAHSFFKSIDWKRLNAKGYQPPFKPRVTDGFDTSNFDKEFTSEQPVDSVINEFLSESVQKQFGGWTYVGTENLGGSIQR